jgi:hypothetical protein
MREVCDKILPKQKKMSCYGGQFEKYEGLTVNFSEAVNSAGGQVTDAKGNPHLDTALLPQLALPVRRIEHEGQGQQGRRQVRRRSDTR